MKVTHLIFMILTSLILSACASYEAPRPNAHTVTNSPATMSYLEQGKRYFDQGYFKSAMHTLLPLAIMVMASRKILMLVISGFAALPISIFYLRLKH
jgi:hypothetical protein